MQLGRKKHGESLSEVEEFIHRVSLTMSALLVRSCDVLGDVSVRTQDVAPRRCLRDLGVFRNEDGSRTPFPARASLKDVCEETIVWKGCRRGRSYMDLTLSLPQAAS